MIENSVRRPAVSPDERRAKSSKRRLPVLQGGIPPTGLAVPEEALQAALALATTSRAVPFPPLRRTTRRTLSRRGVIWLGQTCNLHCEFCYFIDRVHDKTHAEHAFMPLEKAKAICRTLVDVYHNTAVDIEGGEPTLYPDIVELLGYCNEVGLRPTLITNGLVLDSMERCERYRDAGINDFKISIHGLGSVHDGLVGRPGAHVRQMRALRNLQETGIPFRFNVVLTPMLVPQIPDIARLAVATGSLCVNWLGFNPHEDQEHRPERFRLIPRFPELRRPLTQAMDILEEAGIETNVRYVPHCAVEERHRKNVYHFQQLFYDHREWDWASWAWTTLPPQRRAKGPLSEPIQLSSLRLWLRWVGPLARFASAPPIRRLLSAKRVVNADASRGMLYRIQRLLPVSQVDSDAKAALYEGIARVHARVDCASVRAPGCRQCAARDICAGIYHDYAKLYGLGEATPVPGPKPITDALHYIRLQEKLVERYDEGWA